MACLGAGLVSGVVAPGAALDEELSPTARRAFVALLVVGGTGLLLLAVLS